MNSNLCEQLRNWDGEVEYGDWPNPNDLMNEAAEEIERLRGALQEIVDRSPLWAAALWPMQVARKALGDDVTPACTRCMNRRFVTLYEESRFGGNAKVRPCPECAMKL